MGCANLVRRDVWTEVGGYDPDYFLYRNDVELAMTLLDEGWKVHFNPEWVVWHDSPAAARKSLRWFELATRNWIWTIRRHGRGLSSISAIALGWLWAHKLAGLHPASHWRILRGVKNGFLRLPTSATHRRARTGWPVRAMLAARFAR
jgi:GT2 family glycosyltransferase